MSKKAFVTGGSGFVGRNLIAALLEQRWTVRALARSDAAAQAVTHAGAEPVRGDLDDKAALQAGISGCTTVFHAGAYVEDWGPRADFLRVNVEGTANVLYAARAGGAERVVHVSTEAVLCGGPPIIDADESWPRARHPMGLYPETKGMAEERVLAANTGSLTTMIVRPRFIWGRGDTSVFPKIAEAVKGGKFRWIGGGRYLTSTCHVRNVCEGALKAAERGQAGEIYFLTDGPPVEFRAFISDLLATAGIEPPVKTIPRFLARAGAATMEGVWRLFGLRGAPPVTRTAVRLIGEQVTVNDAKARRELGYHGSVTREEGLAEMRR